jgi:hypothetical protein
VSLVATDDNRFYVIVPYDIELLQSLRQIPKRTWESEEHRWYFKPSMYDDVMEALKRHNCCFDKCSTKEEVQSMRIICEDYDGEEFGFNFPYDLETATHFRRAGGKFGNKPPNTSKLWYVGKKNGHKLVNWLKNNGYIIVDKYNFISIDKKI